MKIKTKNIFEHHAKLAEGERGLIVESLFECFEKEGVATRGNPDFWFNEYDVLGIDDARALKNSQTKKALVGDKKIFVLCVNSFTIEAQNALLKVFEEPTEGTHFFIIIPSVAKLLPTLKSRLSVLEIEGDTTNLGDKIDVVEFLRRDGAERLKMLADIIENKDKQGAMVFLNDLERVFRDGLGVNLGVDTAISKKEIFLFDEIAKTRDFLGDRSPSVKMLMEHIAMVV